MGLDHGAFEETRISSTPESDRVYKGEVSKVDVTHHSVVHEFVCFFEDFVHVLNIKMPNVGTE